MADITQSYRQAIVNYLRGNGAPTSITGLFVDVFNGDPQGAGSSVLATVTGSSTRPSAGLGAATAATPSVSTNGSGITLTSSASAGATITHIALYDAATAGNLVASHALTGGSQIVVTGNPVSVPASALTLSV